MTPIKLALHFIRNHFIWIILLFLSQTVRNWYLFLSQGRQISNYDEYKDISWLHSKKHTFNLIWRQQSSNLLGFHTETSHFLKILSESGEAGPDRTMAYKWLHTAHLYYTKCLPSFMWQMLPTNIQDSDSIWTNIKGPVFFEDETHVLLLRSSLSKSQGGSRDRFVACPEVRPQQARSLDIYRILPGPETPVYSGAVL